MINEFYSVYLGLKDVGKELEIKHTDIASPGMGITFRVSLAANGIVDSVEMLTKEKIKDTWSLGNGNKNQFPAAKLEIPLIPNGYGEYEKWKKNNKNYDAENFRKFIQEQMNTQKVVLPDCWPSYRKKILDRFNSLKNVLNNNSKGCCIYELFKRYENVDNNGVSLLSQVIDKFKIWIKSASKEELKAIADVLFGDTVERKKVKDGKRVTLLIDCLPQKDIDIYSSSRSRVPLLSAALFEIDKGENKKMGTCAVTGDETELISDKFPSEKLSVVGPTIILAKSETSGPTVRRYKKSGTKSFSLSRLMGDKLAAAIRFLTTDELKDKTWKSIPSSGVSLLLAYCKGKYDLAITPAITGGDIDDFDDYENAAETVLELFKKSNCTPDDAVEICEIRKVNDGNRQVNYSITSSIDKVTSAANQWITACKNVPEFKLFVNIKKENKPLRPFAIAPIEIINLTKNKYIRDGLSSTSVISLSFADTMTLFMSQSDNVKQKALMTIKKLANQVEALFEYCALSKNQWQLDKKNRRVETKTDKNSVALKTVTLFGILLFKVERRKEEYMSGFAYQLGQLCFAMDELHIGYCQSVRGGDIPNTLIGNTTYNVALQNPLKSLALLASRIKPYASWANKEISKTEISKVSDRVVKGGLYAHLWIKKQSKLISEHFSKELQLVNDTYKAELMLGYLAGRSYNETNDNFNKKGDE